MLLEKVAFLKSVFYSLFKNCKLPCFALLLPFIEEPFPWLISLFFGSPFLVDKLYLYRSTYIRAFLIFLKEFRLNCDKSLTSKEFGAIIRVQQHMDG